MRCFLLVFVVGYIQLSCSQPPVPRRPQGFPYKDGGHDAKVEIDLFIDLACPDSRAAYPKVKQIADYYDAQDVRLKTFLFPLPYHRSSFLACQGAHAIDSFNNNLTYNWIETIFEHHGSLHNSVTANLGNDAIQGILGNLAVSVGMKADDFIRKSGLAGSHTKIQWKYGCTRGVYETPMAFVNGVNVNMDRSWTFEDWVKIINRLI